MSGPIKFSGKYLDYPGKHLAKHDIRKFRPRDAGKTIELQVSDLSMINNTDRDINDFEVYTFPTSWVVDTPDFAYVRIYHKNRLVFEHKNMNEKGKAEADLDSFQVKSIDPAIKPGESFRFQLFFEDSFDGEEGFVILGTSNCALIGCNDPVMAVTPIPEGPSTFELIKEAATVGSSLAGFLLSDARIKKDTNNAVEALLVSSIIRSKTILDDHKKQLLPVFAKDNPVLMMVLCEIHAQKDSRKPLIRKALQSEEQVSDDDINSFSASTFEYDEGE